MAPSVPFMLIPRPVDTESVGEPNELTADSSILVTPELVGVARLLQDQLRPATGFALNIRSTGDAAPSGGVQLELRIDQQQPAEGYRLDSGTGSVVITGGSAAGVVNGIQTLCQLLPPEIYRRAAVPGVRWTIEPAQITDSPRYGWRGVMLDVVRHFMPKHDLLRFVDLLALHKFNRLHLHLTDDQGWRLQIRRYPKLTEIGGWRTESPVGAGESAAKDHRPHGGFYTQSDIVEIVAYALDRNIIVVPEVEIPGHAQAAIAAYPELGVSGSQVPVWTEWGVNPTVFNVEESTIDFLRNVFDEVVELFPSQIIGIGGDECPKVAWDNDDRTRQLMRQRGIADGFGLQAWSVRQIADHLASRGRRPFGWDEILEGDVPDDVVVASWRGLTGALVAARKGVDVVSCPDNAVYLDYRQSESPDEPIPVSVPITVRTAYAFDPMPAGLSSEQQEHVLGGQANLWTEHMDSPRVVDYFAYPRLCAVAEALWSGPPADPELGYLDFERRLGAHLRRLDVIGVEYRRASGPLPWQRRPGVPGRPQTAADRDRLVAELVSTIQP